MLIIRIKKGDAGTEKHDIFVSSGKSGEKTMVSFEVPLGVGIFIFIMFGVGIVKWLIDPNDEEESQKKRKEQNKHTQAKKKTEGKHWRE